MPVTHEEYEDAYAEALRCLAELGYRVGDPFKDKTGSRNCKLDGLPRSDEAVFRLWWGDAITEELLENRR